MNTFSDITKLSNAKTHLITAENVYGEKGRGAMAEVSDIPQPEVERIGQIWEGKNVNAREMGHTWKVRPCINLAERSTTTIMDIKGPGEITHIWFTTDKKYYRNLIMRIYWDNEETPSVEAPLGDFFCCGWSNVINVVSIPINVNPTGGLNSYFPMPFRKHAKITIENCTDDYIIGFFYAISYEEKEVSQEELYFHAQYREQLPVKKMQDYVIIDNIKGKGHYVGTQMGWKKKSEGWWGEGEVKAFIDGDEKYPTYCGTGTEDYFGGAWGFGDNYSAPFMGYQKTEAGYSMYRFHIADPIRFEQNLKVTIQAIGWKNDSAYFPLEDDICSVAYWYLKH